MAVTLQILTNLITDPKAAGSGYKWNAVISDDAGSSAGGAATKYASGSPFADSTTYVGAPISSSGASGATVVTTTLLSEQVPIGPGRTYSVRVEGATTQVVSGMTVDLYFNFYNWDNGAYLTRTVREAAPVANVPSIFQYQMIAPDGMTHMNVGYAVNVPKGASVSGNIYATGAMVIPQSAGDAPYVGPLWDGNTAASGNSTFAWLGAPNASVSEQAITTVDNSTPRSPIAVVPATFRPFRQLAVADWSVEEDATPLDPSDTSGGVGQITLSLNENEDTEYLRRVPINFSVPSQGMTQGTVLTVGATDGTAWVVANSRLDQLNVTRNAAPFSGTFQDGISYYLSLCDIDTGVVIDSDLQGIPVSWPGWSGVVWEQIKKLCAASWIEASLVSDNIVFRELRQRLAQNYRDSSVGWSVSDSQIAQTVAGFYYTTAYSNQVPVFPLGTWSADVQMFDSLAANTVTTQTVSLTPNSGSEGYWASLTSIQQPVAASNVAVGDMSASQYSILAADNSQYDPDKWNRLGGSVTATIGDDSRSITITVVTPDDGVNAPFSLSIISNPGQDTQTKYNSLRLIGTGLWGQKKKITLSTGRGSDETSTEVGTTVDNEFITSRQQLRDCLLWTAATYSGLASIQVTTGGINRIGDTGSYQYPTIADWNAQYAGKTLGDLNTAYSGKKISDLDADQLSLVQNDFSNQAFGNIAGARVLHDSTYYRISTATNSASDVRYTATRDTTIDDFNTAWSGKTLADWNALWDTYRAMDADARILRTA